jgi:DNA topoisomerase I
MGNLLLIESPGKIKKLREILGPGWVIKASMGHVRQLADTGQDALGFEIGDRTIICDYEARDARSRQVLSDLKAAVKQADCVYLATDEDREGETIAWHLKEVLKIKAPLRVTYSEITDRAVKAAIAQPRSLNQNLIDAGRARDCLDKLVGYRGSKHVVWSLNIGAKSMGRVQSAALHILCQREREILQFVPQDYWSVWSQYVEGFKAFYRINALKPVTAATDVSTDDAGTGTATLQESSRVTTQVEADRLVAIARTHPHQVAKIESKVVSQAPPPPFTTSTLQQAAGSRLKFSPDKVMKVAQALYEAGLITYMRTDSVALSEEFQSATRQFLQETDPTNLPQKTTVHRASKTAQAAHEAIRPTHVEQTPETMQLEADQSKLYTLIWQRAIAAQCAPARLAKTRVIIQSGDIQWEVRGQVIEFAGYLKYWNNVAADSQLPPLTVGQTLTLKAAGSDQKQTQPPSRYTEPKLVQVMERKGVGRPSTYAPTIKTLKDREYASVESGKLQPTQLGLGLDQALGQLMPDLINPDFTAQMEAALDAIAKGQQDWQSYLIGWNKTYFAPALEQAIGQLGIVAMQVQQVVGQAMVATSQRKTKTSRATSTTQTGKRQTASASSQKSRGSNRRKASSTTQSKRASSKKIVGLSSPIVGSSSPIVSSGCCPICTTPLEQYTYQKDGQSKVMLRCSVVSHRQGQCKEVAFFQSKGEFWSPKFGTLQV